ncbi:hypothetical protein GGX14DRAFT_404526 [Mycena pura]|uniref:Uncharacterized protein n=1 Tax=Mycena pura TaxID=153505 RepID=A0AAD6Y1I8_9AGAR|nr:hypothetical protein GGX14DRAFT_404526 [Mycena pura]
MHNQNYHELVQFWKRDLELLKESLSSFPLNSDMRTQNPTPPPSISSNNQEDKRQQRRRHAEAQQRYRQKFDSLYLKFKFTCFDSVYRHLLETRDKARTRMARLRAQIALSEEVRKGALEHRRATDADYRERLRQQRFIDKFGRRAFVKHYLPLLDIAGPHLPGRQFVWPEESEAEERRKAKTRRRKKQCASPSIAPNLAYLGPLSGYSDPLKVTKHTGRFQLAYLGPLSGYSDPLKGKGRAAL